VPYFTQYGSRERATAVVQDVTGERRLLARQLAAATELARTDPSIYRTAGAQSAEEFGFLAPQVCGLANYAMIMGWLNGLDPSFEAPRKPMEYFDRFLAARGYSYRDNAKTDMRVMAYAPFARVLAENGVKAEYRLNDLGALRQGGVKDHPDEAATQWKQRLAVYGLAEPDMTDDDVNRNLDEVRPPLPIDEVVSHVREGGLAMLSVSPRIGWPNHEQKGNGHLVLVTGAGDDHIQFHDPADSPGHQENVVRSIKDFDALYGQKGVLIHAPGLPTGVRQSSPTAR
jgi:hypothetical protein